MTDVFGDWVDIDWQFKMLDGMWNAPKQTFQLLTKRPSNMYVACHRWMKNWDLPRMPNNIWLGTTVENQKAVGDRIRHLRDIPASVRFLSCEPLLEQIDLTLWLDNLHWVIVGGESGFGARPCYLEHIHSIVKQCRSRGVAVFVKQIGSNPVEERVLDFTMPDGSRRETEHRENFLRDSVRVSVRSAEAQQRSADRKGGDISEFPNYLQICEFPHYGNSKRSA
jgi:protein gp37